METLMKVRVDDEMPTAKGKYIVQTESSIGSVFRFEARYTITNGKGSFDVSNQRVTHWYKLIEI